MSLHFPPRRHRHETAQDRTERREDARERRLDRQQADLVDREAALRERERQVRARERQVENEDNESSPVEVSESAEHARRSGAAVAAPGRMSREAALIVRADALRRGAVTADDVPLPTDPAARMIAQAARELGQAPKARSDASGLSPAAKLILNADARRRGAEIDEAI